MAGFFSLQPAPDNESGLSRFSSGAPGLEHIGSSASYLDPSLGGGETLHSPFEDEATQLKQGMAGSSIMQPKGDDTGATGGVSGSGGQYISNVTGAQFRQPSQSTQQQPSMSMSPDQIHALQTLGSVQQGVGAIPNSLVNTFKESLKSTPEGAKLSDAEINDYITKLSSGGYDLSTLGLLEGNQDWLGSLNPSETEGYDLGDTSLDTSWLNQYTGTKVGTSEAPGILDKFGKSDVMSALGVGQAAITGDPAAILSSLNRAAPNIAKYITDNKDILSNVGSVAQTLGGAYSLYQGIQSQNPAQLTQGLVSLLQGTGGSKYGLEILSQMTGVSTQAISQAFGALGGVTSAVSLYQAIESGDPIQALLSAGSFYGSLSTLMPTIFPSITSAIGTAIGALAPEFAASIGLGAAGMAGSAAAAAGTLGAGVGVGAGATAGSLATGFTSLSVGLTAGIVLAPLAIGVIVTSVSDMIEQAAEASKSAAMMQQFSRGLPSMMQDLSSIPSIVAQIGPDTTPEQALQIYNTLNTIQRNFQGGEAAGSSKAPGYESAIYKHGGVPIGQRFLSEQQAKDIGSQLAPIMAQLDIGRMKAQDIMQRAGMAPPPGGWTYTPESALISLGSKAVYFDPETGSPIAPSLRYGPWVGPNYQPYAGVSEADLANAQAAGTIPYNVPQWTPEGQAAISQIRPGYMLEDIQTLLGEQYLDPYIAQLLGGQVVAPYQRPASLSAYAPQQFEDYNISPGGL